MPRSLWCISVPAAVLLCGCFDPAPGHYHRDPFGQRPMTRVEGAQVVDLEPHPMQPGSDRVSRGAQAAQYTYEPANSDRATPPPSGDAAEHSAARSPVPPRGPQPGVAMAHAPDYGWVQGQLDYVRMGGGAWRVRYASPSDEDANGGSVILLDDPSEHGLKPGDTVYVEGRVVDNKQLPQMRNPGYDVQRIVRVDGSTGRF